MRVIGVLPSIDISATGLSSMRRRMNAIASNLANAETTQTDEGGPYRRREVIMREGNEPVGFPFFLRRATGRLSVTAPNHMQEIYDRIPAERESLKGVEGEEQISTDPPRLVYDPSHPDANADGYVALPNINVIEEMVDLIVASRAYQANLSVITVDKELAKKALEI